MLSEKLTKRHYLSSQWTKDQIFIIYLFYLLLIELCFKQSNYQHTLVFRNFLYAKRHPLGKAFSCEFE